MVIRMYKPNRKRQLQTQSLLDDLASENSLSPVILLDGPSVDEIVLSINLRHEWRGFSFGNFWFGYYFTSAPREEEFLMV